MTSPTERADERGPQEPTAENARVALTHALRRKLEAEPRVGAVLRAIDPMVAAQYVGARLQREEDVPRPAKPRQRRKARPQSTGDWADPPPVSRDLIEDFGEAVADRHEGVDVARAKQVFHSHGAGWDTCTPTEFKRLIGRIRSDAAISEELAGPCYLFCDLKVPPQHRRRWFYAVLAAWDSHEGTG